MLKPLSILGLCFLSLTSPGAGQQQQDAVSAKVKEEMLVQRADTGDKLAQAEIVAIAHKGDARAERALGDNYEYGLWSSKDHAQALLWYRKAAQDGDGGARLLLGDKYFDGNGVEQDFAEAARWYGCPKPSEPILKSCRTVAYSDLPPGAGKLLVKMKCEVRTGSNYDYGSAVNLSGDGTPAYQFCCSESPHGPCGAVVIGKIGGEWRDLTAADGLLGYDNACGQFVVLESKRNGLHDVCLPNQCSRATPNIGVECLPTIWHFNGKLYQSVPSVPIEALKPVLGERKQR